MMKMKYFVLFFVALGLAGCQMTQPTMQPTLTMTEPTLSPSQTPLLTSTPDAQKNISARDQTRTAFPLTLTSDSLTNPPPTPTVTPVIQADGNVTWHPQKVLISSSESGGDGVFYNYSSFRLFWNGTLLLPGNYDENTGLPYFIQLSNDEICKLFNTADTSGFFEEPHFDNFPFQGLGSTFVSINSWKSNYSGAQILYSAISGEPYYNNLFCRNCPIPSQETIIKPGLANMYSFLQSYHPSNQQKVPVKEILIDVNPNHGENETITEWPLKSMSLDQFMQLFKECNENSVCRDKGMKLSGAIAQEFMEKIGNSQVFKSDFLGAPLIFSIDYRPQAPDVPADATLTCNTKAGQYPILPLSKHNKFWYYASGGKWGAEVVINENKIRVVNTSGYEKFYQYDATFFSQPAIQFYPRFWSADEQFFYVNVLPGDYKPNVSLENSIGLEQIDVKNEKIKYLFLGTKGETFAYEFSTDGKQVAYIRQGDEPLKLVVANTISDEEHAVSLTRPDGTPYTSAGTLIWSYEGNSIFLAASYTENGTEKTDIVATNPNNLALHILYSANTPIKLRKDGYSSYICSLHAGGDDYCSISLDTETGEIKH